jgi:hypothetical protein
MASSTILKVASAGFFCGVFGHTAMGIYKLFDEMKPIQATAASFSMKSAWLQLSGYFLINGTLDRSEF